MSEIRSRWSIICRKTLQCMKILNDQIKKKRKESKGKKVGLFSAFPCMLYVLCLTVSDFRTHGKRKHEGEHEPSTPSNHQRGTVKIVNYVERKLGRRRVKTIKTGSRTETK